MTKRLTPKELDEVFEDAACLGGSGPPARHKLRDHIAALEEELAEAHSAIGRVLRGEHASWCCSNSDDQDLQAKGCDCLPWREDQQ
jgi:hypothetical protein